MKEGKEERGAAKKEVGREETIQGGDSEEKKHIERREKKRKTCDKETR